MSKTDTSTLASDPFDYLVLPIDNADEMTAAGVHAFARCLITAGGFTAREVLRFRNAARLDGGGPGMLQVFTPLAAMPMEQRVEVLAQRAAEREAAIEGLAELLGVPGDRRKEGISLLALIYPDDPEVIAKLLVRTAGTP